MSIFDNVEKIRVAKGVTKTHLASKLNLSLQGYRHLAQGGLYADRIKSLALALGVEPAVFFDDQLTNDVIKSLDNDLDVTKEVV